MRLLKLSVTFTVLGFGLALMMKLPLFAAVPVVMAPGVAWFAKAGAQGNAKGDYWAKWLRDGTNNIGFRNDAEHNIVIGGKLRFTARLMGGDPYGITFRNSAQRVLWLAGQSKASDRDEAEVFRMMRQSAYDDCRRAGRDNCGAAGTP